MVTLEFKNTRRETALLAQYYIDNDIPFVCNVEPFKNKCVSRKFVDGKTFKVKIYNYPDRKRVLSAANVIKAIDLGCYLSDIQFSRITFKDKNPMNYHLNNIQIRHLEYQKYPYKPDVILGMHLGNPDINKKQSKRRARAIVTEMNGTIHEIMYYRYKYEINLGDKIPDGMEIDHIDGDVRNNDLSNLRLVTLEENRLKARLCCEGNNFLGKKSGDYIIYSFLKTSLNTGPIGFANTVINIRFYNPLYVFPITSDISKLIALPEWHDVLYFTYCNQTKLRLNRNESPEVLNTMKQFITNYELVKSQQYLFNLMNNVFIPKYDYLPNRYRFQAKRGISPYDMILDSDGYAKLPSDYKIVPEVHQFIL